MLLWLSLGIQVAAAQGQALTMGDLRIPRPTGYVNDLAHVLDPAQVRDLEQLCRSIDRRGGVQIALVTLPSLEGEPAGEVKTRLFEAWGVGRRQDDRGLLILHALYTGEERRTEPRVPMGFEITFKSGLIPRQATLADLSCRGCRLLTRTPLEAGKHLKIRIPEAVGASEPLALRGRVIRRHFDERLGTVTPLGTWNPASP